MSTSPAPTTKRPLEDPSSPHADLPEAKRVAFDKVKEETEIQVKNEEAVNTNGSVNGSQIDTQPIQSTASEPPSSNMPQDESQWLHLRAVISSAEAATLIGQKGVNVSQIRKLSQAKITVSEYAKGAVERILTVSGPQDAVAKAFGLIIRTLNDEPLESSSTAQSKTYPLRLLIPHVLIGAVIGKSGQRIREVQEASGARLNVSDACLPLSTERSLVILGVADAVHIAAYYVAVTLVEQLTERFGGPAASAYASRTGGPAGSIPGGLQVAPYQPQPVGGNYHISRPAPGPAPVGYHNSPRQSYHGAGPQQPFPQAPTPQTQSTPNALPASNALPGQPLTQQIFIPNDMVGAVIGRGGTKINEIRHLSGSVIKINEPSENSTERLVTITGSQDANQLALYMLYARLENEKHRA